LEQEKNAEKSGQVGRIRTGKTNRITNKPEPSTNLVGWDSRRSLGGPTHVLSSPLGISVFCLYHKLGR
jgi:hypothetical protein